MKVGSCQFPYGLWVSSREELWLTRLGGSIGPGSGDGGTTGDGGTGLRTSGTRDCQLLRLTVVERWSYSSSSVAGGRNSDCPARASSSSVFFRSIDLGSMVHSDHPASPGRPDS